MRMKHNNYVVAIFLIMSVLSVMARELIEEEVKHAHVGNFALPVSQQPVPFIGFGENIVDKGDTLFGIRGQQLKGTKVNYVDAVPSFLYGITDKFSIYVVLPIAVKFRLDDTRSHGLEDIIIQFERLLYSKETAKAATEMTFVANVGIPTGSAFKAPPTGFGGPTVFFGITASYTNFDWYVFGSSGVIFSPTYKKNNKFGNQFLYECGLSRNISYKTDKWILNWIIEFDGRYFQRDTVAGRIDPNSGYNTLLLGPSLWFSTQHVILQVGFSGVVSEFVFGCQLKDKYYVAADFFWKM